MSTNEKIDFTEPPRSYWMASTPVTEYPSLKDDLKVDLAIIGGGMAGISCAYLLKDAGMKIAVIEADRILQGTTGHTTAKVTSQHDIIYSKIKKQISEEAAQQYADANESAIRLIERITKERNIDCDFVDQSAYIYTQQEGYIDKIAEEAMAASSLGIKASYVESTLLPFPIKAAVRFDNQAQFHPRKFLLPLAKEITDSGSHIFEQSRVVDIEENDGYVLTTGEGRRISAEKLLIASHYPCYNKPGLYFTRIYVEKSYVVAIKAKEDYPGGMYINAEDPARSLRSQRSGKGELILVGGEHHKTGQGEDTTGYYGRLLDFANENFNVEGVSYRWSTQDCMTMDGLPYVGYFTAKSPNMYIVTGFGKWGMTNSMASAMVIRDLIIEGKSPWQEVYNPSRHTLAASAKNFVVENLNVADMLIEGKISPLPKDVDIKPGEAKVFEMDGKRTGAYRDENNKLHVVDTTCSHMGCELSWNSAEKTWDCPCHGSRFSYDGDVVEGPTVAPLNVNEDLNTVEKLFKDKY